MRARRIGTDAFQDTLHGHIAHLTHQRGVGHCDSHRQATFHHSIGGLVNSHHTLYILHVNAINAISCTLKLCNSIASLKYPLVIQYGHEVWPCP